MLLSQGTSYPAGSKGGESSHVLTVEEMPSHGHTRGTMNIQGTVGQGYLANGTINGGWHNHANKGYGTGALYLSGTGHGSACNWDNYGDAGIIVLDASKNWTGKTSLEGSGVAHNNLPPYLSIYMWQRVS